MRQTLLPAAREGRDADFDKLKAERDTLIDRLARLQAEFENARKRAVKEQQEFREYRAGGRGESNPAQCWIASNARCRPRGGIRRNFAAGSN